MTPLKVIITEHAQKRLRKSDREESPLKTSRALHTAFLGVSHQPHASVVLCPGQDVHLIWSQKIQS